MVASLLFPVFKYPIQWGSEYQTSLVFKWSKVVHLPNGLLSQCHLNTGLNLVRYSDHHLNTRPVFKWWSEYQTSEYRTSESSFLRCFCYSDVRYSDPHCIQIPTVAVAYLKIRSKRWSCVDAHFLEGDDRTLFLFHEGVLNRNGLKHKKIKSIKKTHWNYLFMRQLGPIQ